MLPESTSQPLSAQRPNHALSPYLTQKPGIQRDDNKLHP